MQTSVRYKGNGLDFFFFFFGAVIWFVCLFWYFLLLLLSLSSSSSSSSKTCLSLPGRKEQVNLRSGFSLKLGGPDKKKKLQLRNEKVINRALSYLASHRIH